MKFENRMFVDGEWIGGERAERLDVFDPATDEKIGSVPRGGAEDTHRAIDAASRAFAAWSIETAANRAAVLVKVAALMTDHEDAIAATITAECGKPLAEARGEVAYARSFVSWAAEEAKRIYGDIVPASHADKRILVLRQPVGVTAAITPWNFPAAMITRKVGPALASGCTMIVKPSEKTPFTALYLARLFEEAGLPHGVLNVVTGDPGPIAGALLGRNEVRKLSFTGSTAVGKKLIAAAAPNVVRLSLELGGHAPFVVFDDANLDEAVEGAVAAKFRNVGQTCVAPNRFYVHEAVHDTFVDKLVRRLDQLRTGRGTEAGVHLGPLIDDAGVAKVERHVADALDRGAELRLGGSRVAVEGCADRFYAPTVLGRVTTDMLVMQEETFGPVLPVRKFSDEAQVLEEANATSYGLAAYFFTKDASRLMRFAERLSFGIVGANDGAPSTAQAPFGGVKESGFGREGGRYVMSEYVDVKYVSWKL